MELGESEGVGGDEEVGRSASVATKQDSGISSDGGRGECLSDGEGGEGDKMEEEDVEGTSDLLKLPLGEDRPEEEQAALYRPGFGECPPLPSQYLPTLNICLPLLQYLTCLSWSPDWFSCLPHRGSNSCLQLPLLALRTQLEGLPLCLPLSNTNFLPLPPPGASTE